MVLPVRNAAGTLADQLSALDDQDHDGDWEAVVVDNGSRDASERLARGWAASRTWARVARAPAIRGAGHARNVGAAIARGDFLAFCDADDIVGRGWLAALARAARDGDLVAGCNDAARLNGPVARACNDLRQPAETLHGFLPILDAANAGVWTAAWRALGGFAQVRSGDDLDFAWRAQLQGYVLTIAHDAVVHVRFRHSLLSLARQYFAYGRGDAWLYQRFAASGMSRRERAEALTVWRGLLRAIPRLRGSAELRGRWAQLVGLSAGRAVGSVEQRVVFL